MDESKVVSSSLKAFPLGWGMVFAYVLFNSFGSFVLKEQVQKLGTWHFASAQSALYFFLTLFSAWKAWLGLISISIATCAWIVALAHLELSKAYPVAIGFNLMIIVILSFFQFQEPLTLSKLIGTFLIFTGVIFIFR